MKLSIKTDYACRAVELMARHYGENQTMHIQEMAVAQGIPENYLVQILTVLRGAGIVKSKRGKEGGYCLARPPGEITFGDVVRAVQGHVLDIPSLGDPNCSEGMKGVWRKIKTSAEQIADNVTFEELVSAAESGSGMFYI
ncbi:MAG: Rrf2 family transcriptional regulator [Verrucomicrobia bacterium]|nr:Rrf2 family transcriptional regulator [Verrucomicrobiota bacterium]